MIRPRTSGNVSDIKLPFKQNTSITLISQSPKLRLENGSPRPVLRTFWGSDHNAKN